MILLLEMIQTIEFSFVFFFKLTENGVLLRFNPITGQTSEGGLLKLTYKIKQLTLLTETDNDFVKGLLIIDAEDRVHVYPEYATKKVSRKTL